MHFPVFLSFFSAVFPAVTGQAQCGEQMGVGRGKGEGEGVLCADEVSHGNADIMCIRTSA